MEVEKMKWARNNVCSDIALLLSLVAALMLSFSCSRGNPGSTAAKVRIATTTQVLADWAENVCGDRGEVRSILTGRESPHTYEPKAGDMTAINQADILLQVGVGLEEWVAGLVNNAQNERLLIVDTSEGVEIIGKSDENPGNPHIWLDPLNAKIMVNNIIRALEKVDPQGKEYYRLKGGAYLTQLDSLTEIISGAVQRLTSRKVIAYHPAWPYFASRFGFQIADCVERIPGKEPSAKHMAYLVQLMKNEEIKVICSEPQLGSNIPLILARETGAELIILTPALNGVPGTDTYLKLIEYNANELIEALR